MFKNSIFILMVISFTYSAMPFAATASPKITKISVTPTSAMAGKVFKFTAELDSPLPLDSQVKIKFGRESITMANVTGNKYSLSKVFYVPGKQSYKIYVYDQYTSWQDLSYKEGSYIIRGSTTPSFSYTKISNMGVPLSKNSKLGKNSKEWACTKDNKTGLIWEIKTVDGGLHDMNRSYNYQDAQVFADDVNQQGLCGANDWRIPTKDELLTLVYCSDGKYNSFNVTNRCTNWQTISSPVINTFFFPNTKISNGLLSPDSASFWSSSQYGDIKDMNLIVYFDGGDYFAAYLQQAMRVRLVRNTRKISDTS